MGDWAIDAGSESAGADEMARGEFAWVCTDDGAGETWVRKKRFDETLAWLRKVYCSFGLRAKQSMPGAIESRFSYSLHAIIKKRPLCVSMR